MSAIVLSLLLCAADRCQTIERPWPGTQTECVVWGQLEVVRLMTEEFPTMTLRRWRCGRPESEA